MSRNTEISEAATRTLPADPLRTSELGDVALGCGYTLTGRGQVVTVRCQVPGIALGEHLRVNGQVYVGRRTGVLLGERRPDTRTGRPA